MQPICLSLTAATYHVVAVVASNNQRADDAYLAGEMLCTILASDFVLGKDSLRQTVI